MARCSVIFFQLFNESNPPNPKNPNPVPNILPGDKSDLNNHFVSFNDSSFNASSISSFSFSNSLICFSNSFNNLESGSNRDVACICLYVRFIALSILSRISFAVCLSDTVPRFN